MRENLFNSFEQELTSHIIKVNFLIDNGWSYNKYRDKWNHKLHSKKYIENISSFDELFPHLYTSDKEYVSDYSIDEANRIQSYAKRFNYSYEQLELQFNNEDTSTGNMVLINSL